MSELVRTELEWDIVVLRWKLEIPPPPCTVAMSGRDADARSHGISF